MFYVYVLKSRKNNNLYIGYTKDLKKRLGEHIGSSQENLELQYFLAIHLIILQDLHLH